MILLAVDFIQLIADIVAAILNFLKLFVNPMGLFMVNWMEYVLQFFPQNNLMIYIIIFIVIITIGAIVNIAWPGNKRPGFLKKADEVEDKIARKVEELDKKVEAKVKDVEDKVEEKIAEIETKVKKKAKKAQKKAKDLEKKADELEEKVEEIEAKVKKKKKKEKVKTEKLEKLDELAEKA